MKISRFRKNKYLMLAVIFIAMLAMSGCRTRITNNSEVSNVYVDEEGFLSETYQTRRDELGLSIAERPILPNFGGSDSEEDFTDFDSSEDTSLNYTPEEEYIEPPSTNTTTNTTTTTPSTTTPTVPSPRPSTTPRTDTNTSLSITYDPGAEGTITGLNKGDKLTRSALKDSSITLISAQDVARENYRLTGWKDSDGEVSEPGKTVKATKTTVYTAQWEKGESEKKYKITFKGNGGKPEEQIVEVASGSKIRLPKEEPTQKNKEFAGWYTDAKNGRALKSDAKVTKDATYYAHWKAQEEEFTVIFTDGQGNELKKETVKKGGKATAPTPDPTREGFTFGGWDNDDFSKVTKNLTVNAKWTQNANYTVTLNYNDDGRTASASISVTEGGTYSGLDDPQARGPGYKFAGWFDENGNQVKNGDKVTTTASLNLTAKWDYSPKDFWEDKFKVAANNIESSKVEKIKYAIKDGSKGQQKMLEDCKVVSADNSDDADYYIVFISDLSEEAAEKKMTEINSSGENPKNLPVLFIDTDATEGSDEHKLLYKMMVLEKIYGDKIWTDGNDVVKAKGENELGTKQSEEPGAEVKEPILK